MKRDDDKGWMVRGFRGGEPLEKEDEEEENPTKCANYAITKISISNSTYKQLLEKYPHGKKLFFGYFLAVQLIPVLTYCDMISPVTRRIGLGRNAPSL